MNSGIEEMKRIAKRGLQQLNELKKEKTKLENQYINTRTRDSEKERITLRLRTFLLPSIRHLEKTLQSQLRQIKALESKVQQVKTARNRMNQMKARVESMRKSPNGRAATRKNHLTPNERKELQNFERNLEREFGPITEANIMNEARRMKAEENAALERIMRNYKSAKTQEQRDYYSKMMNAILNESQLRPMTPEEEREVNTYMAGLKGGLRHRFTRRRR